MFKRYLTPFLLFAIIPAPLNAEPVSQAIVRPTALIYKGPGSCEEQCSEASALMAQKAGLKPIYVSPDALTDESTPETVAKLFKSARVWIQPGGYSREAYQAMTVRLKDELVSFVSRGGGYVGFCAGAFMATNKIGGTGVNGLGIFPGATAPYGAPTESPDVVFSLEKINWLGKKRTIYFEGGPYFYGIEENPAVEIIARYEDDYVAAARSTYEKGRVYLAGPHPEAPAWWSLEDHFRDPDGTDYDLAVSMIKWAKASKPVPLK